MKKFATFIAVLLLVGCASAPSTPPMEMKVESTPDAADFPTLIKQAKAAVKKAASAGGEWRDSGKFIKKAEAAFKAGKKDEAMKLAKKAKREGEMGYAQAAAQKGKAGPWLF